MKRADRYQVALIALGIVATAGMGIFFYRELYPEYRIYQDDYVALEKFRSTYTGDPVPPFKEGIKQIVIEREDRGPAVIDRCTSCHVALQFPHFSPTKIARDINGNILYDSNGVPVQEPNDLYVWDRLDQRIQELEDAKVNQQLASQGESSKVGSRLKEAAYLTSLKTTEVHGHTYDIKKVLSMHPLMGSETRPFEFHPVENYGCTSCHNGNGRGLTTEKAHGPVFDGQYEREFVGYVPQFLEKDPENDPGISKIFNGKPGHELLFQTSPIYVGALIQAKCMQCHVRTYSSLENAAFSTAAMIQQQQHRTNTVKTALDNEKTTLLDSFAISQSLKNEGLPKTLEALQQRAQNYTLPAQQLEDASTQLAFIQKIAKGKTEEQAKVEILRQLRQNAVSALGNSDLVKELNQALKKSKDKTIALNEFLLAHATDKQANGSLFAKMAALELTNALQRHVEDIETSFSKAASDDAAISTIASEVDLLTYNYKRGQELYISQACYACHRIAGFSRGGVGPELTQEGRAYPWYVKQKIVWPQSDLKTSTMPNMKIDHSELEDLMTFVMGQMGENQATSSTAYRVALQQWEAGRKKPWERAITPAEILDLKLSMTIFATQGCAACHRLKGFESDVGFSVEKGQEGKTSFDVLYAEKQWFEQLFPENITGSQIVKNLERHADEIDKRIVPHVRKDSILEEINRDQPRNIESFYTPFKFADRAKNAAYKDDPAKLKDWKERVHRVLMMFIQEYGLGRLIGPRPNWSGVYHTDEWLMEHFRNPAGHVPRSIMPVLPFDDTKFYALTHLLDVLGIRNRDEVRAIWQNRGFSPELAYHLHCAQCHGDYKQGNGPVAEWIYPIPKNLGDGNFLRNLTKENAIISITHGVKGTPMPPWGEAADKPGIDGIAVLNEEEISKLVDWLYTVIPGINNLKGSEGVPKWQYRPEDVIKELQREGNKLESSESASMLNMKGPAVSGTASAGLAPELAALPTGSQYLASLTPMVVSAPASGVEEYFDVVPNPLDEGEKNLYYIKKKYYTPHNIEQGRAFFEINCAVCHGKEADGSGMRAEAMHDAKPRMLTNLDWITTHDDLRLLRSIKYGVPGTAMTPWGDFTSSLQRMQLVIFIRSLSEPTELRNRLSESLYKAFDETDFQIEKARWSYYQKLAVLQNEMVAIQNKRKNLYARAENGDAQKEVIEAYGQELKLQSQINKLNGLDKQYVELKSSLNKERDIYENIGKTIIQSALPDNSLDILLQSLGVLNGAYAYTDETLTLKNSQEINKEISVLGKQLESNIQKNIDQQAQLKTLAEGRLASAARSTELAEINARLNSLIKLKNTIIAGFEESQRLRLQQDVLFKDMQNEQKENNLLK